MLPDGSIEARRVWKRFKPDKTTSLLRFELNRMRARMGGDAIAWQWGLRDVDLVASPGESVGLVGNNGSGKSTLLKILGRVMYPYAGRVETAGRIGALIEVKAGISPELTGRENIHLYGTLLGLSRTQVSRRFDEIVDFAQVGAAVDRQVKYYSSGMQMRLGFGVAAHLDPDILLVDEVLAVGDASFQQRCLDRMRAVLNNGTTLVFVSHDLAAVQSVCSRTVWLDGGVLKADGPSPKVLAAYRGDIEAHAEADLPEIRGEVAVDAVDIKNPEHDSIHTQEPLHVNLTLSSAAPRSARFFLGVSEGTADPIFAAQHTQPLTAGATEVVCRVAHLPLPRGRFFVWLAIVDAKNAKHEFLAWQPVASFDVFGPDLDDPPRAVVRRAPVHVETSWDGGPATGNGGAAARQSAGRTRRR